MPPLPSNSDVIKGLAQVATALEKLTDLIESSKRESNKKEQDRKRAETLRSFGVPENLIQDALAGEGSQYEAIMREQGIGRRILTAQFPDERQVLGSIGYRNIAQGSIPYNMFAAGAFLRSMQVKNAPLGAALYDQSGRKYYSSGDISGLTPLEQGRLRIVSMSEGRIRSLAESGELAEHLSAEELSLAQGFLGGSITGRQFRKGLSQEAQERLFGAATRRGADITDIARMGGALGESAETLSSATGRGAGLLSALGKTGTMLQMGARLAGPIGIAINAARTAYGVADTLYDPARSAAGLGYGFSYNPLSEGARVSLGRSLETRLSALSFGLSGQQTAAARASIEGMGLGGPGQERLYNRYYGSMTDVMKETQLDASVLAPFYEQFMRQGTGSEEIGRLTKMLRDDLPKAAAASRMSLQGMAEMIQRTTQAVAANPLAAAGRTEAEISQALTSAAQAGGPPGMSSIAGGQNPLVVAQTASRLGLGYFAAAQESGQLQATTAELLKQYLGDMSAEEFEEYRKTNQGAAQIMAVGAMTGLSNTDIQKLYDIGLDDYAASAVLTETFSSSNLEKAKTRKDLGMSIKSGPNNRAGGGGRAAYLNSQVVSQKIKGTDFDLYKRSGSQLQAMYGTELQAMYDALGNMGGSELEDFQKKLEELSGQDAIKTYELLQETSRKISGDATRDSRAEGLIDLSDEAKKYFKLEFNSGEQSDSTPNSNYNIGGTTVGRT